MVQEDNPKPRLGVVDFILYSVVLCVHYPLKGVYAIHGLLSTAIVKIISLPNQLISYVFLVLIIAEELATKLINLLPSVVKIPSLVCKLYLKIILYPFSILSQATPDCTNSNRSNYVTVVHTVTDKIKSTTGALLTLVQVYEEHFISFLQSCLSFAVYPLKIFINTTYSVLNFSEEEINKVVSKKNSVLQHTKATPTTESLIGHLNVAFVHAKRFVTDMTDLTLSIPKQILRSVTGILSRCQQMIILSFLVTFNVCEYLFYYVVFLFQIVTKNRVEYKRPTEISSIQNNVHVAKNNEVERLQEEILTLKESLKIAQKSNEDEPQAADLNDDSNVTLSKGVNLDNERNQLQEQIQNLQQEVMHLQKGMELDCLTYEQSLKKEQAKRRELEEEIDKLMTRIAELEESKDEASTRLNKTIEDFQRKANESNDYEERIGKLTEEILHLKTSLEDEVSLKSHLTNTIKELQDKIGEYKKREENLQSTITAKANIENDYKEVQLERIAFTKENEEIKNKLEEFQQKTVDEKSRLEQQLNEFKDEKLQTKEELNNLQQQLETAHKELHLKEEFISTLKDNTEKLQQEFQQLKDENDKLKKDGTPRAPKRGFLGCYNMEGNVERNSTVKSYIEYETDLQCRICKEMFIKAVVLSCSHSFCQYCVNKWKNNQNNCPICGLRIEHQFSILVLDNLIAKILESATEEVKTRRSLITAEREHSERIDKRKRKRKSDSKRLPNKRKC
ncbi:hypothetical protein FQA39_LY03053 [Lamprigera yunnana]|nr:hypothetical protein FQA39_LY03053 [Lamprigera yunnana]